MKIRAGFVSNSSSSSFTILLADLTGEQVGAIMNYKDIAEHYGMFLSDDDYSWTIEITPKIITGYCNMNEFNMTDLLHAIGVNLEHVKWEN